MTHALESTAQAESGIRSRQEFERLIGKYAKDLPAITNSDRSEWLDKAAGSELEEKYRAAFDVANKAKKLLDSPGQVERAIQMYQTALDNLYACFNKNFSTIDPANPDQLKAVAVLADGIHNVEGVSGFRDAQGRLFKDAQRQFQSADSAASATALIDFWDGVAKPPSDPSWRTFQGRDLYRLGLSLADRPRDFGTVIGLMGRKVQDAWATMGANDAHWRSAFGGLIPDRKKGEFAFNQTAHFYAFGGNEGYCRAYSILYATALVNNDVDAAARLFRSFRLEMFDGMHARYPSDKSATRAALSHLNGSDDVAWGLLARLQMRTVREVVKELASTTGRTSFLIESPNHSMELGVSIDEHGQRHYQFFDPNFGNYSFDSAEQAINDVSMLLSTGQEAYRIPMRDGELMLAAAKIDEAMAASLLNMEIKDSVGGQRIAKLGEIFTIPQDAAMVLDSAQESAHAAVQAQTIGDALVDNMRKWMVQCALPEARYKPLFNTFRIETDGSTTMEFLDTGAAGHQTKKVQVSLPDPAEAARLRSSLQRMSDLLKKVGDNFQMKNDHLTQAHHEGEGGVDGSEGLNAAFTLQTIVDLLHARHRQEKVEGGEQEELAGSLAQTIEAHMWANVSNVGASSGKDLSKLAEMVGKLLEDSGKLEEATAKLSEGLLKIGGKVGKAFEGLSTALDATGVALDIAELAQAQSYEQRVSAGTSLALDSVSMGVGVAAMVAGETAGIVMGGMAVPLAGVGIGISALVDNFLETAATKDQTIVYFDELKKGYQRGGYEWNGDHSAMLPIDGVVIDKIDLSGENAKISFGANVIYGEQVEPGALVPGLQSNPKLSFDVHEAFGVGHTATIDNPDIFVLPVTSKRVGWFTTALDGLKAAGETLNDFSKHSHRDDPGHSGEDCPNHQGDHLSGDLKDQRITFDTRSLGVGVVGYGYEPQFTQLEVTLGKAPKQLVIPADNGNIEYRIAGAGGHYSLVPNGDRVLLSEQDPKAPSTWVLQSASKDETFDVKFYDGTYWDHKYTSIILTPVWAPGHESKHPDTHPKVVLLDDLNTNVLLRNGEGVYRLDVAKKSIELVDYVVEDAWVKEHAPTLFHDLAQLAKEKNLNGLTLNWQAPGQKSSVLTFRYTAGQNYIIGAHDEFVDRFNANADGGLDTAKGVVAGFTAEVFQEPDVKSLADLVKYAEDFDATEFDVYDIPLKQLVASADASFVVSGHYDGKSWVLTRVDPKGQVYVYEGANPDLGGAGRLSAFSEKFFTTHPNDTLADLVKIAGGGSFDVAGLSFHGHTLASGHYDAKTRTMVGRDKDGHWLVSGNGSHVVFKVQGKGEVWFYEEDADHPSTWQLETDGQDPSGWSRNWVTLGSSRIWVDKPAATELRVQQPDGNLMRLSLLDSAAYKQGFTKEYFKYHANATLADLVRDIGGSSFDVAGMPFRSHVISGHFDGKTQAMVADDGEGHCLVRGNGSQAALDLHGKSEVWLYEEDDGKASTWLLRGDGNVVEWKAPNWVKVGSTWVWLDKPQETHLRVQQPDGQLMEVDLAKQTATAVDRLVDAAWVEEHAATLMQDLAQLAADQHLTGLTVQWNDGKPRSGRYIVGSGIISEREDGLVMKFASAPELLQGSGTLVAFSAEAIRRRQEKLGAEYYLKHKQGALLAELVAEAKAYRGTEQFDIYGLPIGKSYDVSGHYDGKSWTLAGTDSEGRIWQHDAAHLDQDGTLVGLSAAFFRQHGPDSLKSLPERRASVLAVSGLTDTAGKALCAWYDVVAEQWIVAGRPGGGGLNYLGTFGGMAWLFDAERGEVLGSVPRKQVASLDALKQPPAAGRMFGQLGKLKSATMVGSTLVLAMEDGRLTLGADLALPGVLTPLEIDGETLVGTIDLGGGKSAKTVSNSDRERLQSWEQHYGFSFGEAIRVRMADGACAWYDFEHRAMTAAPQAAELQYLGYGDDFYMFDPLAHKLVSAAGEGGMRHEPVAIEAQHVVRVGNVLGLSGIAETDLAKLPRMFKVDNYIATTKDDLTFEVSVHHEATLLQVGPAWLAAHADNLTGALAELAKRLGCEDGISLQQTDGKVQWFDTKSSTIADGQAGNKPPATRMQAPDGLALLKQAMSTFAQDGVAGRTAAPVAGSAEFLAAALPKAAGGTIRV
ncbi:TcdA/TcdB pore-forming domain-containing protein [Pseudoduganella sp. R-32]|uniref:TcdA/TcdB pore-forming domain-containing protein n=1 Tax=Pseudoduganella sp. R-32 TaxID=3404061 RepID=UPI003CF9DE6D